MFLRLEANKLQRLVGVGRGYHDIGFGVGHHRRRQLPVHRCREGDDPAESGHGVALECGFVGVGQPGCHRRPAGVGVLDHHGGGRAEVGDLMDQAPGGVSVIKVEVGKLHTAVLDDLVPPARLADVAVTGAGLMGVLPVPQRLRQFEGQVHGCR